MIANEREYRITQETIAGLEDALSHVEDRREKRHPLYRQALRESLEGFLYDLRDQIADYDEFRRTGVAVPDPQSADDLTAILIRARTAASLTEKQLADRLGLTEQQIRDYESTRYRDVSLERADSVAHALGMRVRILPIASAHEEVVSAHDQNESVTIGMERPRS